MNHQNDTSASLLTGLIALTISAGTHATSLEDINALTGYHHLSNVNGVGASANSGRTIGLGPGGTGAQYQHIFTHVDLAPGGTTGTITASDYQMFDPMLPENGDASAYGTGQSSWCQQGECAGGALVSLGWNHTSNHILFSVSQASSVTVTLSNAPEFTGGHGPNDEGILGGDLKPGFTIYSGASTTGVNALNHTFKNLADPWTNITYLDHEPNDKNATSITWNSVSNGPGLLAPGYYSLWIGGTYANVANSDGSHGKNYHLSISAASPAAPPTANAGTDQSVRPGALVTLDGSASVNPDGKTLTYQWTQVSGSPTVALKGATSAAPSFTAPNVNASTVLSFRLIVKDAADNQTSDPAVVNVTVGPNQAPIADAGSAGTIRAGVTRTLDAGGSYDPDDDTLNFHWSQVSGPQVILSNPTSAKPTFQAPESAIGQTLVFSLQVSDGSLQAPTASTVSITVVANSAPSVDAGTTRKATEGTKVSLSATGSDPDNDSLTYQWQQTSGQEVDLSGANTASLSFTAPGVGASGETLGFKVTVSDNFGAAPATASATVGVDVGNDAALLDCSQATPSRSSLWPPKKGMVKVDVQNVTGPNPYSLAISGVTQDEPVKDKGAKDNTGPDAKIQKQRKSKKNPSPKDKVLLRAERQSQGDGRVYRVAFKADDGSQSCDGSVSIQVPLTGSGTAGDGSQRFDSSKKK